MFAPRFAAAFLCLASLPAIAVCRAAADAPAPLDYAAYDSWNSIRAPRVSDDGKYFAYALTPEDGDPVLVVRNLGDGSEKREPRGSAPLFAAGSSFVVYTLLPPKKELDAAKKAKKPEREQPKNGLGIVPVSGTAAPEIVESVQSFKVAWNGGPVIAYRLEPSPAASASPSAGPRRSAAPAAAPKGVPLPSPSPVPSASPPPSADKTKEAGAKLTIRDLAGGPSLAIANVSEYVVSDDDGFVAYATETKDGKGGGLHVYDVARRTTSDVLVGPGRYRNLAISHDGTSLAFLSDTATYANDVPHDAVYLADLRATKPVARAVADEGTAGLPPGAAPNANATLRFTRDGSRLFFGTAPAPTPLPSGTPEPMKVDIWTWHDDVLQSQQKHDADQERKRTYLAVYGVDDGKLAQLGSKTLQEVLTNENPAVGLGLDDRPYRRAASWLGERYSDLYAVSLSDGTRRRLATRVESTGAQLAPGGEFVVAWDETSRHWFAVRVSDARRIELAPAATVRFDLEDDDHPLPPQPYGFGGWLSDGRALFYDRYDVWAADPRTGAATNLTGGAGRLSRTAFSPVQPDPEATSFSVDKPILLSLIDERTFASGFAEVGAAGGTPATLLRLDELVDGTRSGDGSLHDLGNAPLAARNAPLYLFRRSTFRTYPNYWKSDTAFSKLVQVTDANPQQSRYRWGSERLIDYRAADGTPLRGVMLVPDGLRTDRKAPMLVYFYERWSDHYHAYYSPAPGTSPNFTRYVSNGYVVLLPDVRYHVGHPGASAVGCLMPAVAAALRTGYVDPSRVGIAGHSWAAYQINYLITKVHSFRAAEAGAAVDDMFSAYGGIRLESGVVRESQYEHTQSRIGAPPWERPDLYLENSGLFGIKNVTTPYLTIHNDQDGAVPQFQGIEYLTAMRRLGKEAYLFSFDGEEHNLRGREQQKFWTIHLDEWFDYWLKGAPRPVWMDGVDYLERGRRDVRPLYGESE